VALGHRNRNAAKGKAEELADALRVEPGFIIVRGSGATSSKPYSPKSERSRR